MQCKMAKNSQRLAAGYAMVASQRSFVWQWKVVWFKPCHGGGIRRVSVLRRARETEQIELKAARGDERLAG